MPDWCTADQIEEHLRGIKARNFTASDYPAKIAEARDTIITDLAGKYPKAKYDEWDASIDAVPPMIQQICARLAAACVLSTFAEGQNLSDKLTKAGELYSFAMDRIKSLKSDTSTLATAADDNAAVASSRSVISGNKSLSDRIFTKESMENL